MKKVLLVLVSLLMVLTLAGCGQKEEAQPAGDAGQVLAVSIASEPDTIDPALNSAVDGATLTAHLFQGLAKWTQVDGKLAIAADAASELVAPVENADGSVTYTYTLREGLKWSDGQDLKASDYVFAWKRAASTALGADYGYMYEVVAGYPDDLAVVADDAARTISVTLPVDVAYWNELLAFPAYFPVREDVVANEGWATDPATYVCNGPYKIAEWTHSSVMKLVKNENYIDKDQITMPEIDFYLSDDSNAMLANFQSGEWLMIDDVPTNEIANLKANYPDEFVIAGQIGTYYVCWNINEDILAGSKSAGLTGADAEAAKAEIRKAVSLLFDRNYIVEDIAQGGQVPASSFVAMGMTDADGTEFYQNAGPSGYTQNAGYYGYYNVDKAAFEENCNAAIEVLKKYYTYDEATGKFTDFPAMTYLYNTSEGHKAIGEYLQNALANYGINMTLDNQEWNTFLNTRKAGDYSIARNGWVADYNDPICFIDMWTSGSGNNDVQYGKGAHADLAMYNLDLTQYGYDVKVENGTWAETFDVLVGLIKTCKDNVTRMALMHRAEDMLMATGCLTPLYFYTDLYMISSKVKGFYSNPLGYKYFMYTTIEG